MMICEIEIINKLLHYLGDIKNQGQLKVCGDQYEIETIMMELRYVKIHLKWGTSFSYSPHISDHLRTWLQDVGNIQPTRKGSTDDDDDDPTEETILLVHRWLQNGPSMKEFLLDQCKDYVRGCFYGRSFVYENVAIDEVVTDWLDPLLENLNYMVCCGSDDPINLLPLLPKKQIKDLLDKLICFKGFFLKLTGFTISQALLQGSELGDLLNRVKCLIENAIYLSYASWIQLPIFKIEKLFYDLLVKMNRIEPETRMIYVQCFNAMAAADEAGSLEIDQQALVSVDSLIGEIEFLLKYQDDGSFTPLDAHNQLPFLLQELSFLKYFLVDPNLKQYDVPEPVPGSFNSLVLQVVEAIDREGSFLLIYIRDSESKNPILNGLNMAVSRLLDTVNLIKDKIRQMYLRVPRRSTSKFPQTPKLGFLEFLVQNLEELLQHRAHSVAYVKNEIETGHRELALLCSFVKETIKNPEKHENIVGRIVDVAYEAEQVIDLISAAPFPCWYYQMWLSDVIEKIKLIREESTEVCIRKTGDITTLNTEMDKASFQSRSLVYTVAAGEEVVGFSDEAEKVINQLTGGSKELDIVSIVGMPGLGKTTLAKKVYNNPSITRYFHLCSWYCISQVYDRRDLLLSILGGFTRIDELIKERSDEDLAEVLYRSLKGRRYLIVLDDIWSIEPWNDIRKSFPDDREGSRVLFTSRIRKVALQANPRSRDPHYLRLFSKEESLELLKKKVFQQRKCPPGLYKIGKQIAENCKGLPLSVVVIAGILRRIDESEDYWREILESMGKQVGDSSQCRDVLELSYKHLPDYLKPCFLYLGAFPEDKEIPAWKLIRLWIAEGLVQKTESENLEEVAEGYLKDLIARSLVLVAKDKCIGGIKSCRLHDLLHEFAKEKAKDEKFLLLSEQLVNTEQYRHCFYCNQASLYGWMPNNPSVRSVLCFPTGTTYGAATENSLDFSVLPYVLKLLRVLDLERIVGGLDLSDEIGMLVHLRYLAIRVEHVPLAIGNLWRLETLLVYGTRGEVQLPETLFNLAYLKHVYVNKRTSFVLPPNFQPQKSSIKYLSRPALLRRYGTEIQVLKIETLQKLKCIFLESWDSDSCCNRFPVLDSLSKLESLNVSYHGILELPCDLSFPSQLKKLTLSKFRLPWSEISKIGRLVPKLEALKLLFKAVEGPRWDVSDDEFPNLKVLKLESLDLVEWVISDDAFPCLEQLVLEKCKKLKEIRSNLGELNTLRRIEVQWCSYNATKAMWEIQEQQEELGSDGLSVLFLPSDWASRSNILMISGRKG